MRRALVTVACLGLALLLGGCSGESAPEPEASEDQAARPASVDEPATAGTQPESGATVRLVGLDGVLEAIRSHEGEVVIVDFWATWCVPCVAAFPRLVQWHEQHGPQGLAVVSLSLNQPEEKGEVADFFMRQGADFEPLLLDVPNFNDFVRAFGRATGSDWGGPVPALLIFGREGRLRHEYVGDDHDPDEVEAALRELLEAGTAPGGA